MAVRRSQVVPKAKNIPAQTPSRAEVQQLLQYYQSGQYSDAEKLAISITEQFPEYQFGWKLLGGLLKQTNRISESLVPIQRAVEIMPQDAKAHSNLGATLKDLGRLEEAEASCKQAIALEPDYANGHYNLGTILKESDRLDEAEASYRKTIVLESNYVEAHINLGATLQALGKLEAAEASYRHAIALRPDYAEAYGNLGVTLQALDRLDEAEASYRKAIALKPDYALAHCNLGIILYINGDIDSGIEFLRKAKGMDPTARDFELLLLVLLARKAREKSEVSADDISKLDSDIRLKTNPLILNRVVEPGLVSALSKMQSREMDKANNTPVYGNGRCSLDYSFFKTDCPIIKTVESDLIRIMQSALTAEIYVQDSFFNIYSAGAGIPPHSHLHERDKDKYLNLAKQKYSLVYYLSVGDQNCSDPGILKLYDPDKEILPSEGMITIFPADRRHSTVYSGGQDRVIIGINFYSL